MECLAVFVSGGPGPGINACISGLTQTATRNNLRVIGLKKSFKSFANEWRQDLVQIDPEKLVDLQHSGGSLFLCSRFNPFLDKVHEKNLCEFLTENRVKAVVIIGGDGSTYLASMFSKRIPDIPVLVCPKTIDNDLPLPNFNPTLGFSTARNVGSDLVHTMLLDSISSERWFIVTCMGRNTGFLATGVTLASGANGLLIPEEIPENTTVQELVEIVAKLVSERLARGKRYGVFVIAEGVLSKLDKKTLDEAPRDQLGRLQYRDFMIGELITNQLKLLMPELIFIHKDLGFELRGARPLAYDVEYGVSLGFGAAKFADSSKSGVVVRDWQTTSIIPFEDLIDAATGLVKVRKVETNSELFALAKNYAFT